MALREQLQLGPRELVCLVGAGGKSTLLEALAREYRQAGKRVIVTTTTKIMPPAPRATEPGCFRFGQGGEGAEQGPGRPLVLGETAAEVAAGIERLGAAHDGRSPVVGTRVLASGKLDGVPVHWVPVLRDLAGIEAVLIEADGAARLPLKAPAAYEPVLPESATLVIAMCGLEAQWVPLDEEHVHRASLLADLLDLEPGRPIPPEALLRALVLGYHGSVPLHARLVCLFNKADAYPPDAILMEAAHRAPVGVWMGAVGSEEGPIVECLRHMERRPAAVVLAAGLSRRMGGCAKVTLELDGVTFVGRAVRAALGGRRAAAGVGGGREGSGGRARCLGPRCTPGAERRRSLAHFGQPPSGEGHRRFAGSGCGPRRRPGPHSSPGRSAFRDRGYHPEAPGSLGAESGRRGRSAGGTGRHLGPPCGHQPLTAPRDRFSHRRPRRTGCATRHGRPGVAGPGGWRRRPGR